MHRVVVYECRPGVENGVESLLEHRGCDIVSCRDGEALLEAVMAGRPDAVVYVFRPDCQADIGMLQLLRRMAPAVPLILLASDGSLEVQRLLQELRPIYYAVAPVEPQEIRAAVEAAITRRSHATGSSSV